MKMIIRLWCVVLCLALLCACGQKEPDPTPPEPEPEPEAPQIMSLECSDGELTLRFRRGEDGAWLWTDNTAFPLDGARVDALLERAEALADLPPLADAEGPEAYGLYDARKYVTLGSSDGSSVTYRFGEAAEGGGFYVVSDKDPARICLAPPFFLEQVGLGIYAMALLPELPALAPDQIREVSLTRGGETLLFTFHLGQWRCDGLNMTDPPETAALESLLADPSLAGCADFAPSDGAAELCGLQPPALVLQVSFADGDYTLQAGNKAGDGDVRFVTVNDDTTIYYMDASLLDALSGDKA